MHSRSVYLRDHVTAKFNGLKSTVCKTAFCPAYMFSKESPYPVFTYEHFLSLRK